MRIIKEQILLEERPQDIQAFNDKFGDGSFDKFNKLKGRLKNNNISQDIVFHTKNTSPDEMKKILYDMENRVVRDKTGKTKNNYKLVAENEHYQVLDILDWETAMNLGNDTSWCITGRYQTSGEVKPSQAKQYFNQYKNQGVKHFLFFMPKGNEEKYCLCLTDDNDKFEFWNAADNSMGIGKPPIDENLPNFTYDDFTLELPPIINGLVIKDDVVIEASKLITDVVIPDSVKEISQDAFYECKSLKSITIPDSVAYIDEYAFYDCTSLESITIPDSVKYIDENVFRGCVSLKSITIPSSVKEIGGEAFSYCKSLESIIIPDGVEEIGNNAFYDCESLQSITIPDSVKEIGNNAFDYCTSLESITFSNSIEYIGEWAFENCPNLTVYTNNEYVINYCEERKIPYKPLQTNESLTKAQFTHKSFLYEERQVDIDAFNNKFGENTFDKFNKLKGRLKNNNISVDIVYHIKNTPVDKMLQLLSDAENRVVKDETGQTKNNYKLIAENEHYKVLDILDWETSMNLGNDTGWCITGRYQTNGKVKPSQAKQYFNQYKENGVKHFLFFMPKNNKEKYCLCINRNNDFEFWNSMDISQGVGNIPDEDFPEFEYDGFILKMPEIINGLVIGNNTVTNVIDKNIKNVDIPNSVTKIGAYVFKNCTSLKAITIPNSVTKIGDGAFYNCKSLKSINIPNSITKIGDSTFEVCKSLKSITIPNSVTKIGNYAFSGCISLSSITIPNSVTEIGAYVFYHCDDLTIKTNNNFVIDYCKLLNIKYERDD